MLRQARHAVWNASETVVAVACDDKYVYVFDATSFRQVAKLGPFSGGVRYRITSH